MRVENKIKPLSICIPTFKQPGMVQEMLVRCLDIYYKKEIDIYIYDSSPDDETELIVLQYEEKYTNIFYKHLPADIHSNIKVLEAYKEIIETGKYKYVWLCPDYIQLTQTGVSLVLEYFQKNYDICILNYRDVENIGEKEYSDINTFFQDCAWHMSSYMATIICLSSFADVEWDEFYERYTIPRRINLSHVAFYFEHLAKLSVIKAVHVPISSREMRVSSFRKESMWKKDVFTIWCDYWPDMIYALPNRYRNKEIVIKKLGINTGIFGWNNFVLLRREGIFDLNIYRKYQKEWKKLTDVPQGILWMLAVVPRGVLNRVKRSDLKKNILNIQIRNFCKKHQEIYVYGCGFIARKTSNLLDKLQMNYGGYIVSERANEKENFNGHPVMGCEDLFAKETDIGIIVALNHENTICLIEEKQKLRSYKLFFMHKYEDILE